MTTPAAARLYEAQHLLDVEGRRLCVFNPHDQPVADLPVIYGFNNGGSPGWYAGLLMAEDGTVLGGHICSSEAYMPHDLACIEGSREDRHTDFAKHYPRGYRMEFVGAADVRSHAGLMAAYAKNQAQGRAAKKEQA